MQIPNLNMERTFGMLFLLFVAILSSEVASKAMTKSAHDLIMEVNDEAFAKRGTSENATEDLIIKINEAIGNDMFEGDIKMTKEERKNAYGDNNKRNIINDRRYTWRTRVVPYVIEHSSSTAHTQIKAGLAEIVKKVKCLTFRPKISSDPHYIRFYIGAGCWSEIGRKYYKVQTDVSLASNCLQSQGLIIHEVVHALGFYHEQSRPDRDSFVVINYENIPLAQKYNFDRRKAHQIANVKTVYDYKSIMHYSRTTFTSNGKDTMYAKFDPSLNLGSQELSQLDIQELNEVYQCHRSSSQVWSDWSSWLVCYAYGSKCRRTRQRYCFASNKASCPGADDAGVQDQHQDCSTCLEPMNGHWSAWGSWGSCSKNCDEGTRTRKRLCNNPAPANGGSNCPLSNSETKICRIKKCSQKWYDTSFEDGWGMWKQSTADGSLNWIRYAGSTPTANTGPTGDHTTHYGYYAYVESGVQEHYKNVILLSSELPANFGQKCLSFYYSMNGKNMGSLTLTLLLKSGNTMWLWQKKDHQGTDWKAGVTNLPALNEAYRIQIKATLGVSPNSDIAIDDIFIDTGACDTGIETCEDKYSQCDFWARTGECHKNTYWMLRSCCLSCTGRIGGCTDSFGSTQCKGFAKDYGCTYNGEWMWKNCCTSCKDCLDRNGQCSNWAGQGECEKNPTWMKENCKVSCKVCKA